MTNVIQYMYKKKKAERTYDEIYICEKMVEHKMLHHIKELSKKKEHYRH
jgi:hypothetical protein